MRISAAPNFVIDKANQVNTFLKRRVIHTDLKTAAVALTTLATIGGVAAAGAILYQKHSQ